MYIATIDTGTTNTRVSLWKDEQFLDAEKRAVGVRNTSMDGDNHQIVQGIAGAMSDLLGRYRLRPQDVGVILASGMITSNLGLVEVPHIVAPVDSRGLADHLHQQTFKEISPQPIWFVPGVKNGLHDDLSNWEAMDIMRGEEVEAMAVVRQMELPGNMLIVLPGSHTKFVATNADGQITGCCTTLAGELNAVITHNTVLSSSLESRFADQLDKEYLLLGAQSADRVGLTRSFFSVRVLEQFGKLKHHQLASFLLGAIAETDIKAFMQSEALNYEPSQPVVIGGSSLMAQAFIALLDELHPQIQAHQLQDEAFSNMAGKGCIQVAKAAGLLD